MLQDQKGHKVIRIGDSTDHGGLVLTGDPQMTVMGKSVARIGDTVSCPKCSGEHQIIDGSEKITTYTRRVAFDGNLTSCGARLISSL